MRVGATAILLYLLSIFKKNNSFRQKELPTPKWPVPLSGLGRPVGRSDRSKALLSPFGWPGRSPRCRASTDATPTQPTRRSPLARSARGSREEGLEVDRPSQTGRGRDDDHGGGHITFSCLFWWRSHPFFLYWSSLARDPVMVVQVGTRARRWSGGSE